MNVNPRSPGFRPYSDVDTQFLFGEPQAALVSKALTGKGIPWKRTLTDAGVGEELAQLGIPLADFPGDEVTIQVFPDSTRVGSLSVGLDVVAALAAQFRPAWDADARFEKAGNRWKQAPDRVQGYVPGDAGSVRWTMLNPRLFEAMTYEHASQVDIEMRTLNAEGAAWAYMGAPHFIPADVALDVVTADPPAADARAEIRLPHRYVMVFHDGVPISVIIGDDDVIDAFGENTMVTGETLVLGGLLSADDEGRLFEGQGYLIVARRDPQGWYAWQPVRVFYGDHAAGRVLYNYAALLSWEGWTAPPKLPVSPKGKAGSANQLKKAAKSPQAQAGGWHGVRVLDYRPPAPSERQPEGPKRESRERAYRGERRAHWTKRTRFGIRDEEDRLIGPVYGANAVEGETFVRRRKFIRRSVVRADLPERPEDLTVYRLPADAEPTPGR